MRHFLTFFLVVAFVGCDRNTSDAPELSGTWAAIAGGDSLLVTVGGTRTQVTGLAEWGMDQYVVDGSHDHPEVSLRMTGPFTATNVVRVRGTFSDSNTIQGTMSAEGLPEQPVTLRRTVVSP
jgi:hypothetical protein